MSPARPTVTRDRSLAAHIAAVTARSTVTGKPSTQTVYTGMHCPDTDATYRYNMGAESRWFRCQSCGSEMPESALLQRQRNAA